MCKPCFFTVILFWAITNAGAQLKPVNGYLQDSITHFVIVGATISNGTTGKSAVTGKKGNFRLDAAPNDLIYAEATSYTGDTLRYSLMFTDTITIFLAPEGNIMPAVTVTSKYTKYQLDSAVRKRDYEEARGQKLPVFSSSHPSGFGLTFNLDNIFKKKNRNQSSRDQLFERTEKTAYVNYRFSPQLVAIYTGLKGDSLRMFLNKYTPSFDWLRKNVTNEDVLYYVNDKVKEYRASTSK